MQGPQGKGHWSASDQIRLAHEFLVAGRRYRVTRRFTDFDADAHLPGEEWTFLGKSFLPYEDGLSLFVSLDGTREWQIRLQWRPEGQAEILDHLSVYLALA